MKKPLPILGMLLASALVLHGQNGSPSSRILKVGAIDVTGARIDVEDESVDLVGAANNYRGYQVVALAQPQGQKRYLVVGSPATGPGNVFTIGAVRFPARDCDLLLGVFPAPGPTPGEWLGEQQMAWALARSIRVPVTAAHPVAATAGVRPNDETRASLTLTAIDGKSLGAGDQAVVPVNTEVGVMSQLLPPHWHVYGRVRIPYSNLCTIFNATRGSEAGSYVVRDVNFDAAGNPLQDHFDVMAFASAEGFSSGPLACDTLNEESLITSSTIHVTVDSKSRETGRERVPFIRITKIGDQNVAVGATPSARQGASIEVGTSERLTEGAKLTAWCGKLDSNTFLVSSPLVPRGEPAGKADGDVSVTWVLPNTRFLSPTGEPGDDAAEYKCFAVLSATLFPETWLDGSALSSHSIETVSQAVTVRVKNPQPDVELSLSIENVCGQHAGDDQVVALRPACSVVVEARGNPPAGLRIFVAGHAIGDDSWKLVQAMKNGHIYTAPDFPLGANRRAMWQFVALPSLGALPVASVRYGDFLPQYRVTSELVTAEGREPGVAMNRTDSDGGEPVPQTTPANSKSWWRQVMNAMLLSIIPLALLAVLLALLEWQFGVVSPVAGLAADWLERALHNLSEECEIPSRINVGRFLLGISLATFLTWLIATQYLRLYTDVLATVTGMGVGESRGWARYLVVMAGVVGILIDLSHQLGGRKTTNGGGLNFFTAIRAVLSFAAVILWAFSACLYFEFLRNTSSGLVAPLGAIAAFLISMTESLAFYFATVLTVDGIGWVVVRALLAPFYVLVGLLRLVKATFGCLKARKPEVPTHINPDITPAHQPAFGEGVGD